MSYKRGDVVLVPFPFTDLSGTKKRPAVIISPDWYNERFEDIVVVAVTRQPFDEKVQLALSENDMQSGNILPNSYVRFTKIFTISQSVVLKVAAHIHEKKMDTLLLKIKEFYFST